MVDAPHDDVPLGETPSGVPFDDGRLGVPDGQGHLPDGVAAGRRRHGAARPGEDELATGLADALVLLRSAVAAVRLPLVAEGAGPARAARTGVLEQLDDYLLPRLRARSAPALVVLGGSTGSGKSTLLNSLLGATVSASGVLRPTTRWPVLVHHPLDARWFADDRVLPELPRVTGADDGSGGAGVRLVASPAVPQGLAVLDAPDIDSVVVDNRRLARQLLGAADLWLFVTTAARYADAVPWDLLAEAAQRRTELAVVLDRVDPAERDVVVAHLRTMLAEHGLDRATVLVVPETGLVDGLLPAAAVGEVADWLTRLGADPQARREAVTRTRDGLLCDLLRRADDVARAGDAQEAADRRLRAVVAGAYAAAAEHVRQETSDGSLLRGEVLARWQELVGTGELMRAVEQRVSRWRDQLSAMLRGRRAVVPELSDAIGSGLDAVVLDAAESAAERAFAAWRADPAGAPLLDGLALSRSSADLRERVAAQVRGWQSDVLTLVDQEGSGKRTQARVLSYGVNGLGVALMLVVFAQTAGLTGAEVGIAGGTAVLAQRLLEAVFGDGAVRRLATRAQTLLDERVRVVLDVEAARFTGQLDALGTADAGGGDLRVAIGRVERAPRPEPVVQVNGSTGALRGAGLVAGAGRSAGPGAPGPASATPGGGLHRWWRRMTGRGRR